MNKHIVSLIGFCILIVSVESREDISMKMRSLLDGDDNWRCITYLDLKSTKSEIAFALATDKGELLSKIRNSLSYSRQVKVGWKIAIGDQFLLDPSGTIFNRARVSESPPMIQAKFKTNPARASRWRTAYRGLYLARTHGAIQGGFFFSRDDRDINNSGNNFLLDMPHSQKYEDRINGWEERMMAAWCKSEFPMGADILVLGGFRQNSAFTRASFVKIEMLQRRPGYRIGFHYSRAEHEVIWLQGQKRLTGRNTFNLNIWSGRRIRQLIYSAPALRLLKENSIIGINLKLSLRPLPNLSCQLIQSELVDKVADKLVIPWYRRRFKIIWNPFPKSRAMKSRFFFYVDSGSKIERISLGFDFPVGNDLLFGWRYAESGKEHPKTSGYIINAKLRQESSDALTKWGCKLYFSIREGGSGILYQFQSAWPGYILNESGSSRSSMAGLSFWAEKQLTLRTRIFLALFIVDKWRDNLVDAGFHEIFDSELEKRYGIEFRFRRTKKNRR
jgi:hypothetical protein